MCHGDGAVNVSQSSRYLEELREKMLWLSGILYYAGVGRCKSLEGAEKLEEQYLSTVGRSIN